MNNTKSKLFFPKLFRYCKCPTIELIQCHELFFTFSVLRNFPIKAANISYSSLWESNRLSLPSSGK